MLATTDGPAKSQLPVHRAFRQALASVADKSFEINLDVTSIEDLKLKRADALEIQPEGAIYFSILGPNDGPGLAILNSALVSALIEVQTLGEITQSQTMTRAPTATDAAMSEGFVADVLNHISQAMTGVAGDEWACDQRIHRPLFDLHRIPLELPDIGFRLLRAGVGFGPDGKQGELTLIFPAEPVSAKSVKIGRQTIDAIGNWNERLVAAVQTSEVQLNAVLHRGLMTLSQLRDLKPGADVPLPENAQTCIRLEGIDGLPVATGRIGMLGRMKALRISAVGSTQHVEPADEPQPEDVAPPLVNLNDLGILPDAATTEMPINQDHTPAGEGDGVQAWGEDREGAAITADSFDDLPELDTA